METQVYIYIRIGSTLLETLASYSENGQFIKNSIDCKKNNIRFAVS